MELLSSPGRTFSMYLAHLVKGCQLNDCDATSQLNTRVRGVARGLTRSKDTSRTKRPALSKARARELVSRFSRNDGIAPLAVLSWILLLRVKSEGFLTRRSLPLEDMSDTGPANSHSARGLAGGRLVLKLYRRRHVSTGAIPSRCCFCESYVPNGG